MLKLQRSDLVLAVLGLAGIVVIVLLYDVAFPTAAVDLEVTRQEAIATARAYLQERGADLDGYREATHFGGDTLALVFLQRTLGIEEASRWARQRVPVWTWDLRWFRPEQKEEWHVSVGVGGEVTLFRHLLEEAAEGAELQEAEARRVAEEFLRRSGWSLADLDEVEASVEQLDNRTDHRFIWEVRGSEFEWRADDPEAGSGSIRVGVRVQGDEVGGYSTFLRVPEEFRREFEGTLSVGTLLTIVAFALMFLLALAALGVAIWKKEEVRWRTALVLGALVGLLLLVQELTTWPTVEYTGYQTQMPWNVFIGITIAAFVVGAILYAVLVLFPIGAGDALARERFPATVRGLAEVARGKLLRPEMAAAGLRGYALAAAIMGYLTLFYWLAREMFGAWLPAEGPYSEIFNNALPWVTPLTISLVAAVSEEAIFRLFGISLFARLLSRGETSGGVRWSSPALLLALLLPAVIWAFAHSNYPVFPVYVRGIELTIGGLIFGVGFLTWGFLTVVVAHYVIDAVILGLPLVTSGNPTYLVSGLVVMGLALLPAILGLLARRRSPA